MLPALLQSWMSARAGYLTLERGVFVDRPSARALYSTLERVFHATSTFAGLEGPLERGPCFLKFRSCVLCFVFRSRSLVNTLRHVLNFVNEINGIGIKPKEECVN